jgi:hypothetical protein
MFAATFAHLGSGGSPSAARQRMATRSAHAQYASSNVGLVNSARRSAYDSCAGTSGGPSW